MVIDVPAHVLAQGLVDGGSDLRQVDRDVMLETVLADVAEQPLQV
jgi:hypothetical protein